MFKRENKIKTKRLYLREIISNDTELIVAWRENPEVYQYFRSPHKLTLREHIKWYNETYLLSQDQIQFIAIEDSSQREIGVFSVRLRADIGACAEVSYLLDYDAQGKGYAQEAVLGLIEFVVEKWNVVSIIAEIHKNNRTSIKLIQKLEFELLEEKDDFLLYKRQLCCT